MTALDHKDIERADVYQGTQRVGKLWRTEHGCRFEYVADPPVKRIGSLAGIALSMPVSQTPTTTSGVNLPPFFAGLLPEGWRLKVLLEAVKTAPDDLFSLLLASGTDTIGDVSVIPENEALEDCPVELDLTENRVTSFREALVRSMARFRPGSVPAVPAMSGVQDKISASMVSLPVRVRNRSSHHILKIDPQDKPGLVRNEAYFLSLARHCGIRVPRHELLSDSQGQPGLLIQRFDRIQVSGQPPRKLHQEDACQFLDRYPWEKYRLSCRAIAEGILAHSSAPLVDLLRLLRLVAFSYLIANGDLHGKNISLQESPDGKRMELSPAYDLVSTLPYGDRKMALKIEGRDDNLKRRDFIAFGSRMKLKPAAVNHMLEGLIRKLPDGMADLESLGLDAKRTTDLRRVMQKRLGDLA